MLQHTLEIAFGPQSWHLVTEVKLVADFPTNSAIWLTRAAEMRALNGLANARFIGYRDPQLHPRLYVEEVRQKKRTDDPAETRSTMISVLKSTRI